MTVSHVIKITGENMYTIFSTFHAIIGFCSDLLTAILAAITLYGIYKHRSDIDILFRFARNRRRSFLISQVKSCLRMIEEVQNKKTRERDTLVYLGELSGLLRNLKQDYPVLDNLCNDIDDAIDNNDVPSKAVIKRLITELDGKIDKAAEKDIDSQKDSSYE